MNVFIVENSSGIRASLRSVLSDMTEIKIIGQAMSEAGTIDRINALLPDVVIINFDMQPEWEVGVLKNVKEYHTMIKVIVITHYFDDFSIERCKRAGADYFFNITCQLMQLRETLHRLMPQMH